MNVIVDKKEFEKSLFLVQGIIEKKGVYAVLSNVLLKAEVPDNFTLMATNLEIGFKRRMKVKVEKAGIVAVSGKVIYDIVRESSGEEIIIKGREKDVELITKTGDFNILKADPEDFPKLPESSPSSFTPFSTELLKNLIDKTIFAASTDETRYQLNGVFFKVKMWEKGGRKYIESVATDAHRLSLIRFPVERELKILEQGIIAPRKGLMELKKALKEMGENIGINVSEGLLFVNGDDTEFSMRLVEGQFPNYEAVLPTSFKMTFEVEREALKSAIERVLPIVPQRLPSLFLRFEKNRVIVRCVSPETGEGKEIIPLKSIHGPEEVMEVAFNAHYLLDALNAFESSTVNLKANDAQSAWLIDSEEYAPLIQVIMPMKI